MSITQQVLNQYNKNKIDMDVDNEYYISIKEYYLIKKAIRLQLAELISNNPIDGRVDDLAALDGHLTYQHRDIMKKRNLTDKDIPEIDNID